MKKTNKLRLFGFIMVFMLAFSLMINPTLADMLEKQISVLTGVTIYVDDELHVPKDSYGREVEAFIYNGTTYLPARSVSKAVGKEILWDGSTNSVYIGEHKSENKTIKVLSIGNSFSDDAQRYLHGMAEQGGFDLTCVNLYIGGCTLETHWKNASENLQDYQYKLNGENTGRKASIKEALEEADWDYITLQQASALCGRPESYHPYIEDLAKYVHELEPNAELLIHQTWAYANDSKDINTKYDGQEDMHTRLVAAYNEAAESAAKAIGLDKPLRILPGGAAFAYARQNDLFNDTKKDHIPLNRDGNHASYGYGRYILSGVWYEALTGVDLTDNAYIQSPATVEQVELMKTFIHKAIVDYGWRN